jgi:hypothetical protein
MDFTLTDFTYDELGDILNLIRDKKIELEKKQRKNEDTKGGITIEELDNLKKKCRLKSKLLVYQEELMKKQ